MPHRKELKAKAKEIIRDSRPNAIAETLLYIAVALIISWLTAKLSGYSSDEFLQKYYAYYMNGNYEKILELLETYSPTTGEALLSLVLNILLAVVGAGYTIFTMNTVRKTEPAVGNLLDGFGIFGRFLLLEILEILLVSLWGMLLIIPGFIAAYSYRLSLYILIDNPDMSAAACLRESRRLMKGHKWELFKLDLSFLGWRLLQCIPGVSYIAQLWVTPYSGITRVLYYDTLRTL